MISKQERYTIGSNIFVLPHWTSVHRVSAALFAYLPFLTWRSSGFLGARTYRFQSNRVIANDYSSCSRTVCPRAFLNRLLCRRVAGIKRRIRCVHRRLVSPRVAFPRRALRLDSDDDWERGSWIERLSVKRTRERDSRGIIDIRWNVTIKKKIIINGNILQ